MRDIKKILCLFILFPYLVVSQVSVSQFPKDLQLFKRDTISNTATVTISGQVEAASGFSSLVLETYENNVLLNSLHHLLYFNDNVADFEFSENITAGLISYQFILKSNTGVIIREASNVVAGDIYIMNGQSNAIRNSYANSPFPYQNNFIRTFLLDAQEWSSDPNPFIFGGIGYWFAQSIVDNQNIPVLLLNGGEGGKSISHFQRNEEHASDLETNYGRLLSRYNEAHFTSGDVRGIIWFQGEANAFTSIDNYVSAYNNLYEAWNEDYAPDYYYIFQVRYGCDIPETSEYRKHFQTPEAHRRLGLFANTRIISTNATTKGFDDCHYYGTNAYANLANRLYDIVAYDFYDSNNNSGIYSPNVENIRFTNSIKNQIKFDLIPESDTYFWQNGVENDFWIEDNNDIIVSNGSITGNTVTLNLSGSITALEPKLSYLGHNPNDSPFIINQNSIGMLSFKEIDISDSTLANDKFSIDDFSIYPNPVTDVVYISSKLLVNSTVVLYDITGKKVYKGEQSNKNLIKIDVSNISSGQYFVKILNQYTTSTKLLIIK
ncbi:sialate O-acetylesterase [uncultured Dokdonia sp.]|uniref:T9SS type A sorting domain-containing protein n=1 Tax=uncultured Dokdonia sp. TaxID=575653 RepID=UPI002610416D|nr:sialate O-acetylesterase [uncultured Dokdonia sp.]